MTISSFKVPVKFVTLMDQLVIKKIYTSRGDFIKTAINDYADLYNSLYTDKENKNEEIVSKSIESFFKSSFKE